MFCCSKTYIEAEQAPNEEALKHNGPKIALCPDWRKKKGKFWYFKPIIQYYRDVVKQLGGALIVLGFEDTPEQWKDRIDGLIIPGGRDIDPKFYGQENLHSSFNPQDAELRWNFCSRFIKDGNPMMPILGVCYGFQVINCVLGGDMVQTIGSRSHYKKRLQTIKPGSFLERATGMSEIKCTCYHHQKLGRMPDCLQPTAWDKTDQMIHAFEYVGADKRPIYGVLWHPEACYAGDKMENHDPYQLAIYNEFIQICSKYAQERKQPAGERVITKSKL